MIRRFEAIKLKAEEISALADAENVSDKEFRDRLKTISGNIIEELT
jgi:hypothetical protein